MGFLEENGNSEIYKHLTKPENSKINQKWTLYLAFCCMTVCLGSFQFGYNIGSMNLIEPIVKSYFDKILFKELFYDKFPIFYAGQDKLIDGIKKYNNGTVRFNEGRKKLDDAREKQSAYIECMTGIDCSEERKRNMTIRKELKTKEIREEHNMTVEDFIVMNERKIQIAEYNLSNAKELIAGGLQKLEEGKLKIIDGRIKLNVVGQGIWGFTNSMFVFGGLIGALTSKYVMDYLGRKNGILFHLLFSIVGSVLIYLSCHLPQFSKFGLLVVNAGRFLQGIQGGMSCSLIPTYLSEIAPSKLRGQTGVIHNLFLTFGLFTAQFLSLEDTMGTEAHWYYLISLPILPAVVGGLLFLLFFSETPKYLLFERTDEQEAVRVLQKLRNSHNVSNELSSMYIEATEMSNQPMMGICEVFGSRQLRWPLTSGIVLQMAQQLCGINVIFLYSRQIFDKVGFDKSRIELCVLFTGLINIFCTMVCGFLVDRIGRKPLLVSSMTIMTLDLILLTVCISMNHIPALNLLAMVCVIVFLICFAIGLGPIPYIFVAESFKENSRSSAMAISTFSNWLLNLILILFFPLLLHALSGFVFIIFTVVVFLVLLFVIKFVPETKGKSADEIHDIFQKKAYPIELQQRVSV